MKQHIILEKTYVYDNPRHEFVPEGCTCDRKFGLWKVNETKYVKGKMFPVKILHDGKGLRGDWRTRKTELEYRPFELPACVENATRRLMNRLGLNFGGIDLAYSGGKYYLIEVNPTGEWGWLEANTGAGISCAIKDALVG